MPSRHHLLPPSPSPSPSPSDHTPTLLAAFSLLLLLTLCFRRKHRTSPSPPKPPLRYSYSTLRRSTSSFSPSLILGQGGFGSVYLSTVPPPSAAVKLLHSSGSLQGEREFHNELFFASKLDSKYIVSVLGFSSNPKRRRMLLVYELMPNGSLQESLLYKKSPELKDWKKRFEILYDVAKGLEYLHHFCDPPVIHGDIKPSNILLDKDFRAKIGDLGLARVKDENNCAMTVVDGTTDDNVSVLEDTESVTTAGFDEFGGITTPSPDINANTYVEIEGVADVGGGGSRSEVLEKGSVVSEGNLDRSTKKSRSGKDWWWKQDNNGEGSGGIVKDYVMEWIGNEINKERPKGDCSSSGIPEKNKNKNKNKNKDKKKKRLDWWMALDDEKKARKERRRPAREWWKEEYCEELARKNKKKKKKNKRSISDGYNSENCYPIDDDFYVDRSKKKKKKRSRSKGSLGSMDWWLDGLSGDLWRARGNSHDSASGDICIHKSGGVSSTPSMRGTVCYTAPEYTRCEDISEKCDVYSFGVLLLVLIAGRRPLQVTNSPLSEFQRANLISWSRNLARSGKLLALVDKNIQGLDKEQAILCITIGLLCIQRSPIRRPSMKEIVGMLSGELDSPKLPVEFSPSPPCRFPYKSKKGPVSF